MPILLTDPCRIARFRRDDSGAVAVVVALLLTVLMGFVALGVDVAALYRERALLQTDADLAALSSVARPDDSAHRAATAIARNGRPDAALAEVQVGRFLRNPALPRTERFMPLDAGMPGINAIAVRMQDHAPLHFAKIFTDQEDVLLSRDALAIRTGAVRFSLGSHIARLDAGALSTVLSGAVGANVQLGAAEMSILAQSPVNLGALLADLAQESGFAARNPAAILDTQVRVSDLVAALQRSLPAAHSGILSGLQAVSGNVSLQVGALVGGMDSALGLTATELLTQVDITALDVLQAVAQIGTTGQLMDMSVRAALPGVLAVQAKLVAGEPEARSGWITLGEEGMQLHRAALRLATQIEVAPGLLANILPGVSVGRINVPVYTELAGASATLEGMTCGATGPEVAAAFSTSSTPLHPANGTAVAALYLGHVPPAMLVQGPVDPASVEFADLLGVTLRISLPLLPAITIADVTLQARAIATVGQSRVDSVAFTAADLREGRDVRHFGSGDLLTSGVADLLSPDRLQLRVKPEDQGIVGGLAQGLVQNLLAVLPAQLVVALTGPLDNVLDDLLSQLGLGLGEGALTLTGHHCEMVQLVQ